MAGFRAARETIVARKDEDRETFLRQRDSSKAETDRVIKTVPEEEGRLTEQVFDFVQASLRSPATSRTRMRGSI